MIMDMNSRELHRFELIACLDMQLKGGEEVLKCRLQTIPNGWRDYRMIVSRVGRLIDQLYNTMPERRVKYMEQLCAHGEILIRVKPAAKSDENLLIPVSALKVLVNHAMKGTCTMCFDGRDGVKKCKLRKALMEAAPPVDLEKGECPYRYVVESCEEGEYI